MDASKIKRKISGQKQFLDGQLTNVEGTRRKLASTRAQQLADLQDATTRLCHIFARQEQSGFAGKILPSFKKVHTDSLRLIAADAERLNALDSNLIPAAQGAADALQARYLKAKSSLDIRQAEFDQALESSETSLLQADPEAAHLSSNLEAGRARSERLAQILGEMKSQYQDLDSRLQQDPVFAYFDARADGGSALEQSIDRVLSRWCNFPAQSRVRKAARDQVRMWDSYSEQLTQQMRQHEARLDKILDTAKKDPAVAASASLLLEAKSEFDAASSDLENARETLHGLQDERERLDDGTGENTLSAIGNLATQINRLTQEQLRQIAAGTTTQEDDLLVDDIAHLGRPGSSGLIDQTERALQQVEAELVVARKRREDLEKIEQGIASKSLVSSRSRFRSANEVEEAIDRVASGDLTAAKALAIIVAQHYLLPLPPPPPPVRRSSSSSSSSSSSGGFGSGGGFGGGGFSSGGGFGGGGGFSSGGGF